MVCFLGSDSELDDLRAHLDPGAAFSFASFEQVPSAETINNADLVVIGPSVNDPINCIRDIVAKNRLISILLFAESKRYHDVKKSVQFSLNTGKNTLCVAYTPSTNYTDLFGNAIRRTQQKRNFQKFNLAAATRLAEMSATGLRIDNLGHVLEHAPIGAILVNEDLDIIGANTVARKMFFALDENRLSMSSLFPYHSLEVLKENIRSPREKVFTVEDLHGNFYEIGASAVQQHGPGTYFLMVNDVTERVLKNQRIEAILESLPQIAWTALPDGTVNYYTQAWYSYTNLNAGALGDGWVTVIHPDDLALVRSHWEESVRQKKTLQQAARFRKFNGEYRWHLTRAVPIYGRNRNVLLWVGTSTDIHDQVLRTEDLERKVRERTRALEETNAELEHFAHISSHDLQEPLRKIQTFAHIVREQGGSVLTEPMARYVEKIISTSERMSNLLRDLLSFTRINQREKEELLNLNEVIDHIREDLELLILQTQAVIEVEDLPVIKARPLQIKQLFYNLTSNALKFRQPDVAPVVSIRCRKLAPERLAEFKDLDPNGSYWEIIVKDNGIGFDQKYAGQVFTIFQRLHNRASYEGTGIGLAIARKVVTNHGGEIFAVSEVGKGAEFHVVLPSIFPL